MQLQAKQLGSIIAATAWISISEFVRNQVLFSSYWTNHYHKLGLIFPSKPIHGAIWGIWSFVFASIIYALTRKFTFWQSVLIAWVNGFVLMWLVIGNLGVLPFGLLWYAIPLSVFEAIGATWLIVRISKPTTTH